MYQHYPSVLRGHGTEANSGHPGAPLMAYRENSFVEDYQRGCKPTLA